MFQNGHKLGNVVQSDLGKTRKTGQVSVLDFPQFSSQKLVERGEVLPQIWEKSVFCLEDGVDLAKHFKNGQRKTKMGVDEGIPERERDVLDGTKGEL